MILRRLCVVALLPFLLAFHDGLKYPPLTNGLAWSGIVEGFYGPVYTFEQRRTLFEFVARAGMNTWLYAPKTDPYHREHWREPYPAEQLAHFGDLATLGAEIGVRFVFAVSPGLTYDPTAGDLEHLQAKLDTLLDVGVRDFCILFDDVIGATHALDPDVQVDAVVGVLAHLRARDPATTLCFISPYYEGRADELRNDATPSHVLYGDAAPSSVAYAAYGRIPVDVPIMWTGPRVFSNGISKADAEAFAAFAGRPVIVWDNFPVNDNILEDDLFLGPYERRGPGLEEVLHGVLVNPMIEPAATKIPLFTVGRALALGADYDPDIAWREALAVVGGSKKGGPLGVVAEHFRSHPMIGDDPESPSLDAAVSAFLAKNSGATRRRLKSLFRRYVKNEKKLMGVLGASGSHPDPQLWDELAGPSAKLRLFGEAGLLALDVVARERKGKPADRTAFEAKLAEANAIAWFVGKNFVAPNIAAFLSEKTEPNLQDVFGRFFAAVNGDA